MRSWRRYSRTGAGRASSRCGIDGERRFPAHVRATLLRDERGRPAGCSAVVLDISARRAAERKLRSAHDFLDTVTQTMLDGLYVMTAEGRVSFINRTAERLLGWTHDELDGRAMHDVIHSVHEDGSPHAAGDCPITRSRGLGDPVRVDHDVFTRRDGTPLPVSYSSVPFETEDGELCYSVVFTDITARLARESEAEADRAAAEWQDRIAAALREHRFEVHGQPIVSLSTGRHALSRAAGADADAGR